MQKIIATLKNTCSKLYRDYIYIAFRCGSCKWVRICLHPQLHNLSRMTNIDVALWLKSNVRGSDPYTVGRIRSGGKYPLTKEEIVLVDDIYPFIFSTYFSFELLDTKGKSTCWVEMVRLSI